MPTPKNYNEAMQRLETIVSQLENGELDVDKLADKLKDAKQLIDFCKSKLLRVEQDVKKILDSAEDVDNYSTNR